MKFKYVIFKIIIFTMLFSIYSCSYENTDKKIISAINQSIKDDDLCLTAYSNNIYESKSDGIFVAGFYMNRVGISYDRNIDITKNYLLLKTKKQLEALKDVDLIKLMPGINDNGINKVYFYEVTSLGKKYARLHESDMTAIDFCIGNKEVYKIENYAKISKNGMNGFRVKYSYKFDLPSWAKNDNIFNSFSLNVYNLYGVNIIELFETNNGLQKYL